MPAEPDGHDLLRHIEQIRADLKAAVDRAEDHVTTKALSLLLARYDDRIGALTEDLAQERGFRTADVTALRDWVKVELERIEKRDEKTAQAREAESRERRADRRVVYGGAIAGATGLLLWVLDKWPGGAP